MYTNGDKHTGHKESYCLSTNKESISQERSCFYESAFWAAFEVGDKPGLLFNTEGRIVHSNKKLRALIGYEESELRNTYIWDRLFNPLEQKRIKKIFRQIKETASLPMQSLEVETIKEDGSNLISEIQLVILKNSEDDVIGYYAIITPVISMVSKYSEGSKGIALDSTKKIEWEAVFQPGIGLTDVVISDSIEVILGFSPGYFRDPKIIYSIVHPDDREPIKQLANESSLQSKKLIEFECRVTSGSGILKNLFCSVHIDYQDDNSYQLNGLVYDITGGEESQVSNSLLPDLFNDVAKYHTPALFFFSVVEGAVQCFSNMNESAPQLLGLPKEEILNMRFHDVQFSKEIKDAIQYCIEKNEACAKMTEGTINTLGQKINVEVTCSVSLFEESLQVILSVADTTFKKRLQTELIESELRFSQIAEALKQAVYIRDASTDKFIFISNNYKKHFDLTDDMLVKDSFVFIERVHPMDMYIVTELIRRMKEGQPCEAEYRIVLNDKQIRWKYEQIVPVINEVDVAERYIGIIDDVTGRRNAVEALKESESKFRSVIENSAEGIILSNGQGTIIEYNKALEQITGYSREEIIGENVSSFIAKISVDSETEHRQHNLSGDISRSYTGDFHNRSKLREVNIVHKDGRVRTLQETITPIPTRSGIYTVSIKRDVTEQKVIENRLFEYAEELKELNNSKDKFFSIIAHDLRSPLQALIGFSELLFSTGAKRSITENAAIAGKIHYVSKQLYDLLENLLYWSRMQIGTIHFQPSTLSAADIVDGTIGLFSANSEKKKISVINSIDRNCLIEADENMMQLVLRNLLSNAIKFTKSGGTIIFSSEYKKEKVNNQTKYFVEFAVSDSGIGMSEEIVQNLFSIEKNIARPGTERERGNGLGLILCKEFVQKHGGNIWVSTKTDEGSVFYFTIPMALPGNDD